MKNKDGSVLVVTDDNAADIARRENKLEKEGKNPENEIFESVVVDMSKEEIEQYDIEQKENNRLLEAKEEDLNDEDKDKKIELIKKKEEEEGEEKEKTSEELIAANVDDLNEEEKVKRIEIVQAEEEETKRLMDAKDEDLNEEDKEKKKTVVLKLDTKNKEEFETRISDYAKKKEISVDDSRKVLEGAKTIISKYSGDNEQIAIANLGLQQLVSKKDEEILAVKQEASQPKRPQSAMEWETGIKERGLVRTDGKHMGWETVVDGYRKANESETDGMEDEQVLRIVAKEIHLGAKAHFKEQAVKARSDANEKRTKLVSAIPEKDKQFTNEVTELLKTVPDMVILNRDFDISHSLNWARGGYFTPDKLAEIEKVAEEKGFKRGQASKKIISGPVGKGGKPKSDGVVTWSEKEKGEAYDMFPNVSDEKERFKLWKEVNDSRAKNRKKK